MLEFAETMKKYYREQGCTEKQLEELSMLLGSRCLHYTLHSKIKTETVMDECKKVIFQPGQEACIVIPLSQLDRVTGWIESRNLEIKEDAKYRKKGGRVPIRIVT